MFDVKHVTLTKIRAREEASSAYILTPMMNTRHCCTRSARISIESEFLLVLSSRQYVRMMNKWDMGMTYLP